MADDRTVLDADSLLAALVQHDVEFFVIGGLAVAVHGYPRATKDLDIVPRPSAENLVRLIEVLGRLDATPHGVGDFKANEFPELTLETLVGGGNWCLATSFGRLDILQFVDGVFDTGVDFDSFWDRSITVEMPFGPVRVVGYDDLVEFKQAAGRPQDNTDLRALAEARSRRP